MERCERTLGGERLDKGAADSRGRSPEGRSVVVDGFPVPTLVLQEVGVVVVNLGVVGQSLNA